MGTITDGFATAFRDFVTEGVPASGEHDPVKSEIRAIGPLIESALGNIGLAGLVDVKYATKAALDADLAHAANSVGLVYGDAIDANNDLYVKSGASGSGSWSNTGALHSVVAGLAQPFVDDAEAAATAAANSAIEAKAFAKTKVEAQPPLKPQVRRNALRALYGTTSGLASSQYFASDIPTYLYSSAVWNDHGEPNVLRATRAVTGVDYAPQMRMLITPADLAAIGVIPDDTNPPQISFRGALRLDTAVNQNITAGNDVTGRFWILLRYNGVGASLAGSNTATDVLLSSGAAGASSGYLGAGDAIWAGNQAEVQFVAGKYKRIRRQGFKIPATFGGKALSGIMIDAYGRTNGAGTTTVDFANLALIAGASIDWDETILNPTDKVDDLASDAELAAVNTAVAGKAPYSPPLKPASYQNAIPGRYSPTGSSASALPWSGSTVSAVSNVWSDDVFTAYGEPNVQRIEGTATGAAAYQPEFNIVLTATDLARIGIVPDDVSPPVISVRATILLAGLVNQTINTVDASGYGQLWVGLRYDGVNGNAALGFNTTYQDVVFTNSLTGPSASYYVPSPNPFASVTGRRLSDTARLKGYAREGIPIPATVNGKAFTHLKLKIYGRATAAGAYALNLARLAVVAGSTIADADSYVDYTDVVASGAATGSQTNVLTIQRAQKIGAIGNSFTESYYTPRGKHWLAKLSALTDYNVENFAVSGDTNVSNLGRIRSNDLTFGNRTWRDYGVTYGLVMNATNDPSYETWDEYRDDLRGMCETLRSTGAIPILASEFTTGKFGGEYQRGLQAAAIEQDALFVDITPTARNYDITASRDLELWGSGHPGARNNELISDPITRFINALPRPAESLKIFRKRTTVTVSSLDDLVHDSLFDRARLFREIEIGHTAMTAGTEKYLDLLATGSPAYERVNSEYLALQAGQSIAFADYGLVDAIINGTDANVSTAALVISDPSVTVYVRDLLAAPYEASTQLERFTVGTPTVSVGATYTSNDAALPGTFTVVGLANGSLVMSPMDPNRAKRGAGTLTKVSGSGDATIAYTSASAGYPPEYYANLRKPEGHWVAVSGDGSGRFTVTDLRGRLQVDRLQFLLYKSGGFTLSKCEIEYVGGGFKPRLPRSYFGPRATGAELLAETKCGTSGQLAGWTVEGTLTPGKAGDDSNGTPYGTTGYVTVTNANRMRQAFTYAADLNQAREVEIVVKARRWPSKVNSGTYPTGAGITAETFDWGQLEIALDDGGLITPVRVPVGLWWKDAIVRMTVPAFSTGMTLRIGSADSGGIQVAGASVKLV